MDLWIFDQKYYDLQSAQKKYPGPTINQDWPIFMNIFVAKIFLNMLYGYLCM